MIAVRYIFAFGGNAHQKCVSEPACRGSLLIAPSIRTMDDIVAIFEVWFKALLTLVVIALSTSIAVGPSARWRPVFVTGALAAAVVCEYYFLLLASAKIPRDWAKTGVYIERLDCLRSTKGGKRADGSTTSFDVNPCFCPYYCRMIDTGAFIPASMCPKDGSAFCWDKKGVPVPLYMDSSRDCSSGQGSRCTKDEPCTPCDLDAVEAFLAVGASGVSRCRQCGVGNSGACHFVLDEGPYCWKEPGSSEIEPCSICCTSAQAQSVDGTCF